jgi:hypothetical protein
MAETDWTFLTGILSAAQVARGTVQAFAPPSGGGTNVYALHSLTNDVGAVAKYVNASGFIPMPKGGSVRAAIRRATGMTGATPYLFMSLQGTVATNEGYLLGLAHDEEPARLVLVKGTPATGLAIADAIADSGGTYEGDEWLHVRLDVIRQPDDNVLINVYENDLSVNDVTAPAWTLITGLSGLTDDVTGITYGSAPYLGGRAGVGYYTESQGRYGLVDHVQVSAQI